jgi:hypothetical protein
MFQLCLGDVSDQYYNESQIFSIPTICYGPITNVALIKQRIPHAEIMKIF